jgi:hypothetical protein
LDLWNHNENTKSSCSRTSDHFFETEEEYEQNEKKAKEMRQNLRVRDRVRIVGTEISAIVEKINPKTVLVSTIGIFNAYCCGRKTEVKYDENIGNSVSAQPQINSSSVRSSHHPIFYKVKPIALQKISSSDGTKTIMQEMKDKNELTSFADMRISANEVKIKKGMLVYYDNIPLTVIEIGRVWITTLKKDNTFIKVRIIALKLTKE